MRIFMWISNVFAIITICGGVYEILGPRPWNPLFWIIPMILSHIFNYLSKYIGKCKNKNNN